MTESSQVRTGVVKTPEGYVARVTAPGMVAWMGGPYRSEKEPETAAAAKLTDVRQKLDEKKFQMDLAAGPIDRSVDDDWGPSL